MSGDAWRIGRIADQLEEIDRELARLALLCRVPLLRRGVVERILHGDATVCGTNNPIAFAKLHGLLMLYFAVRDKTARELGQRDTALVESYVVARLRKPFPELAADWPPA